jgi:PKD repeat protein
MKFRSLLLVFLLFNTITASCQVPIFNSLPGSPYVIFLDFDGYTVSGSSWNTIYNSGNPIVCAPSGFSNVKITETYNLVAEDYRPFNINVTTDSTVFAAAPALQKTRVVITPTQSWYPAPAGGVAYLNSFTSPTNNICFAFVNSLSNDPAYTAEASSHEAGHTFGLNHHSQYNGSCTKTGEYNNGVGSGEIGWAPIMGVGYYKNQTTWSNIAANFACSYPQSDLDIITGSFNRGVAFKADDHGNTNATATALTLTANTFSDSGIITSNTDIDVFKITLATKSFLNVNADPWNYGPANTKADLDILLTLKDAGGNALRTNNPATLLNASFSNILLPAGDYFIYVAGTGNANQNGYGSIGKYYVTGSTVDATVTALAVNFIASDTNICKGSSTYFTDQSTGNPISWTWTFTGGTPSSFIGQNPGLVTYNISGLYAVSLTVSDGISNDTKITSGYIKVNNPPTIGLSPANPISCGGAGVLLSASGASTYSWTPTTGLNNAFLNNVTASVTADATFTVTGTDLNGCQGSKSVLVKYYPSPVLVKVPAASIVYYCKNDSVDLSVSGALNYAWTPSTGLSSTTAPAVKASLPYAANIFYTVTGTDINGCTANAFFNVITRSCDSLSADFMPKGAVLCTGETNNFSDFSTGSPSSWKWTFNGGTPSTSTLQNPGAITYNAPGQYDVTLQVTNGTDTSTKTVTRYTVVADFPVLSINPASPAMCLGDSLLLTAASAQNYLWDDDITLTNKYSATVKVKPGVTTKYLVTGTNYANGIGGFKACTARDSATVVVTNCGPLALHIIYFKGLLSADHTVQLQWQLSQEDMLKTVIERSYDGIRFTAIGSIEKTNPGGFYNYSDTVLSAGAGVVYYRLKLLEKDNNWTISDIIKTKGTDTKIPLLTVWPNPVTDIMNIKIIATKNGTAKIAVKNSLGQAIMNVDKLLQPGTNTLTLNLQHFAEGIYFVNVNIDGEVHVLKMIKQ